MKFKKGDQVKVTAGKDKGKTGKIDKVFSKEGMVLVSGVNIYKRHLKKRDPKRPSGIVDVIKPLPVARVALICPKCSKATRVGFKITGSVKIRFCKKCQKEIT